jgi:opacity protein-like surface antigen
MSAVPAFSQTPAQIVTVTAARTSLRDKAAADGAIVASVVKGDELEVLGTSGSWYHVRVKSSGKEGFVNDLVVSALKPPAASSAPTAAAPAGPPAAPPTRAAANPAAQPASQTVAQTNANTNATSSDRPLGYVLGGLGGGFGATSLNVGGGVAIRPFENKAMGLRFDGILAHSSAYSEVIDGVSYSDSTNALVFSGLFTYDFVLPNLSFKPFVGGGLSVMHVTSSSSVSDPGVVFDENVSVSATSAGLTVIGGLEKPFGTAGHSFRVELRGDLGGVGAFGTTSMILAGISF